METTEPYVIETRDLSKTYKGVQALTFSVPRAARQGFMPVRERAWLGGFGNIVRKELGQWWGKRAWWVQILIWVLIFSLTMAMLPVTLYAQSSRAARGGKSFPTIDANQMSAFFVDLIPRQLAERHIPGAVVVAVQDGELLFEQGYGYANLENQIRVDPETSLFSIGSITRLFTWTAVMQAVALV